MRDRLVKPAALVRPHAAVLLAGVLVWFFSWDGGTLMPISGLDGSWQVALHMAAVNGLDYGRDIMFTYGPLGFLLFPRLVDPTTVRLAFAYELGLHVLLCISLVAALRPTFRLVPAALIAYLVASLGVNVSTTIGLVWVIALLTVPMSPLATRALSAALGALVGIELLGKLNQGSVVLVVALVAIFALPRDRRRDMWLPFGVATVLAAALGWFGSGQSLGALPAFLSGSASIVAGYTDAMGREEPEHSWQLWAAIPLVAVGLAAATRGKWRPDRLGLVLAVIWLIVAFTSFKEGFVRQDPGHAAVFFGTMLGGFCAFALVPRRPPVALLAGATAVLALCATWGNYPGPAIEPITRAGDIIDQVELLADGSDTNDAIGVARNTIAASAPLDPATFEQVRDHSVHVADTLASTAWAYRLRWHPLPIFQAYSAYTESLDQRNADELTASAPPERILVHREQVIDGRNPAWEQPLTTRTMLCRFRPVHSAPDWQVLAPTENRCGEPRLLDEVDTSYGKTTEVPAGGAGEAVYVEVEGAEPHGLERLQSLLLRSKPRYATFQDGRRFRLIPGTAGHGLFLSVHQAADYAPPFALNQAATSITLTRGDDAEQSGGDLKLRFFALPIRR